MTNPSLAERLRKRAAFNEAMRAADKIAFCERSDIELMYEAATALTLSSVPEGGWKLVPVEPTEAMLDAYWHQCGESKEMRSRTHAHAARYYHAMIAASPQGSSENG